MQATKDKIGQEIKIGSLVAAPVGRGVLSICRVVKIAPKQLRLEQIKKQNQYNCIVTYYKYHNEVICIDGIEESVLYLLSQNL